LGRETGRDSEDDSDEGFVDPKELEESKTALLEARRRESQNSQIMMQGVTGLRDNLS